MQRLMCKGKIHRAIVTEADLDYVGSITIDSKLMEAADIRPFEMVQVTSLRNATRWKTYAIPADPGSGKICLNGPPARLFQPGDIVFILSMATYDESELGTLKHRVVLVDEHNQITEIREHDM
ncbi:aspartate 1-decarboxylase [Tumebacillus flagellatus]|uniref:Aspartate 1-decarboxylase n=1 Tax=Tumebacillus flagellatus TaxID=1157490 RepID=A0A074LWE5_9BACL|nr:aspartate 1-decarboxylase [Tumebacillus flagellatus]KEO84925.1 L-aspartate 1-decarboxylase [Tumebacillus flagellatus]